MTDEILSVRDLKTQFFTYGGVVQALDGISFGLKKNETLGLVGETGCGKSVTALSIIRLIPPPGKVISGEVMFEGADLLKKTEKEMRDIRGTQISMVFQDPTSSLNPLLTVGYQIAELFVHHEKLDKSSAMKKSIDLMKDLGLPDPERVYKNYPHEISGGMRQRVMIAMSLALNPKVLICDEPTTNLDVTVQAAILDFIIQLQRKYNTAILWISHNLSVVAQICQRVAVMYAGDIVEIGKVDSVMKRPVHPYTNMLENCALRLHECREGIPVIKGTVPNLIGPPSGCRFHPRCPYATDTCSKMKPSLVRVEPEHFVSCWSTKDSD